MGREDSAGQSGRAAEYFEEVRQALAGNSFTSIEEANAFLGRFNQQRNAAPHDNFDGLSPDQMGRLLYFPFDTPQLVSFPEVLPKEPFAPVVTLFDLLTKAIGEAGLKGTATGNLPRNFCREAAMAFWGDDEYRERTRLFGINKEEDFQELNTVRFIGEDTGLIRKYKGKFILSKGCRALLAKEGMAGIYPVLLKGYATKFNWGYWDRYPDIEIIQHSFLYTLYLLSKYGDVERPNTFYEEAFVRAFPMALDEVPPMDYFPPEKQVGKCYTLRTLVRFVKLFGLAEVVPIGKEPLPEGYRVKVLPLLKEAVQFHLSNAVRMEGKPHLH